MMTAHLRWGLQAVVASLQPEDNIQFMSPYLIESAAGVLPERGSDFWC